MADDFVVAIGSGLLGAVLTQGLVWARDAFASRRSRHYSALRLALMCERYAVGCASDIELRTGYHEEEEGSLLPTGMKLPDVPDMPDDIDFKIISTELMERIFSLAVEVRFEENALSSAADHLDGDDLVDEYLHAVARRGLQAWQLGIDIRKRSGLPASTLNVGEWGFVDLLREYAEAKT